MFLQRHDVLASLVPNLRYRAQVMRSVRSFFDARGFVETETPIAVNSPAPEEYIDAPRADVSGFLRASPELQMKRLVCAGMPKIYQVGSCFRAGEKGRLHREEFTLLEWYEAGANYRDLIGFLRDMICETAEHLNHGTSVVFRGQKVDFGADWEIIAVRDAFQKFAGKSADELAEHESDFELVLTTEVEPRLPKDRPCVLIDYPVRFGAFARPKASDPTLVERWEVYAGGVELANTYGELTDARIQRERFQRFAATRAAQGLAEYPVPEAFLESFDRGMPACSGSALGFDRLVMLLAGQDAISDVSYPQDS